ncbi:unnamed protein product [Caenorhabditis bovis]|uniref:Diacylglycerol kinase n=1 Tax=Caenorhabditis bovis TaxID=2654633 RepID=A0A8S1FA21_9PELO|nr:unnamed protein product [Caenorhabditis bovis]
MVSSRSIDDTEAWRQSIVRAKLYCPEKAMALDSMLEGTSGNHQWTQTNHPRPTFCNYCREKLSGVPWHGYTCDICKIKAHRKCTEKILDRCKWTVEASIPQHLQYISPENSIVPHQWVEGNLPMPAKCVVCEKPCGSVRKLQDWRCLWCACCVHSACLSQLGRGCSLGPASLSVIPPLAMKEVSQEGTAVLRDDAYGGECGGGSPLIVLINSKSGDSQGQRIIKKFRRLLNPCQVFDLITSAPEFALTFFSQFESFRVLVCGGDGTVGWVLSAFDRLNLHSKCQLAILPLGTGNDLARVLGWGHAFYDDTQLPQLVRTLERAHTKMLDRWSVLSIEGPQADAVRRYEDVVIEKVRAVLEAEQPHDVIVAVTSLCELIRELMSSMALTYSKVEQWEREDGRDTFDPMSEQCTVLLEKLDKLMRSLENEVNKCGESGFEPDDEDECFVVDELKRRESLVNRANSLKKALRDVIAIAEQLSQFESSSTTALSIVDKLPNPSIGTVQPPTPGGTREPSTANDDEGFECLMEKSTVYHPDVSSSGTGVASRSTLSPAKACGDGSWSRSKDRKQNEIGSFSSSNMKSCRNILSGFTGGSLIAEVLLLNARVLSTVKPNRPPISGVVCHTLFDQYKETCVMNNYFGIGLDAKIALEFHNKREESEKTRSRSKLFLWYGMLGGKELMHRTYRNLDQRIRLECDGVPIDLPSLQGIVILNIPSYSGGANFWGRGKDDSFTAQSFDDRILEVVALFGVIHVATSRVPNVVRLQNHRIAQCRHVRIVILGDEPIPVQVDGEPWLQPPGIMQIVHKNRAQMLAKNPVFDATLKKWEEQKERSNTAPSTPTALSSQSETIIFSRRAAEFLRLVESEIAQLGVSSAFLEALDKAALLVRAGRTDDEEQVLGDLADREEILASVERVVELLEDHFGWPERTKAPFGQPRLGPAPHFNFEIHGDDPDNWKYVINSIRQEMDREEAALREIRQQNLTGTKTKRSRLTEWLSKKFGSSSNKLSYDQVMNWNVDLVCTWLNTIGLSEYSQQFKMNDIQGNELIHLERSDIHELGIKKIGHVKRLQVCAIDELREREAEKRRAQARRNSKRAQAGREESPMSTRMTKATSLSAERWTSNSASATPATEAVSSCSTNENEKPSLNSL